MKHLKTLLFLVATVCFVPSISSMIKEKVLNFEWQPSFLDTLLPKNCDPDDIEELHEIDKLVDLARRILEEKIIPKTMVQAAIIASKLIEEKSEIKIEQLRIVRTIMIYVRKMRKLKEAIAELNSVEKKYSQDIDVENKRLEKLQEKASEKDLFELPESITKSIFEQALMSKKEKESIEKQIDGLKGLIKLSSERRGEILKCEGNFVTEKAKLHKVYLGTIVDTVQCNEAIVRIGKIFEGTVSPHIISTCASEYNQIIRKHNPKFNKLSEEPIIGDDDESE